MKSVKIFSLVVMFCCCTGEIWSLSISGVELAYGGRISVDRNRPSSLRLRGGLDQLNDGFSQGPPSPLAIKRVHSELAALQEDPPDFFRAKPMEDDILDWHFVLLGAPESPFARGLYHGRIQLDRDYPMKPPRVIFLTQSGRFELGTPLCLSITSHHAECWQPTWDIRTALTAIRSFMETPAMGAIGGIESDEKDREFFAEASRKLPRSIPFLSECSDPSEAFNLHVKMHRELAELHGIQVAEKEARKSIKIRNFSVASFLLEKIGVFFLWLANMIGGVHVDSIISFLHGQAEENFISNVCSDIVKQKMKEKDEELAKLKQRNLKLERDLNYSEQRRLEALAQSVTYEEKANEAEQELGMTNDHIQELLQEIGSRNQILTKLVKSENMFEHAKTSPKDEDDEREEGDDDAAERLLEELQDGSNKEEMKKKLEKAKLWAMQRLAKAKKALSMTKEEEEKEARLLREQTRKHVEQEFRGLKFSTKSLDDCIP